MSAKKLQQSKPRYIFWTISLFMVAFLLIAPFNTGLFNGGLLQYENAIFYSILFGSLALIVVAFSMFYSKNIFLDDPLPLIMVWLIPISLFISSLTAASHTLAVNGVFIYLLLAAMFVIARYMTAQVHGHLILTYSLIGSGYLVVIFGFMNWFGDASFFGLINLTDIPDQVSRVYRDAVQVDSNGPRMASVFQYANTYAAYLTGLLFVTLYLMVTSNKKLILTVSSLMLVPILLSLLLTLSRGGWATALLSYLIVLFFIHTHKQILMLIYSFIGLLGSVVIYSTVNNMGSNLRDNFSASTYTKAWLSLIAASAVVTLFTLILHRYAHEFIQRKLLHFSPRRWASSVVPIFLIVLGVIFGYLLLQDTPINRALPDQIEQRVDNINFSQHSVLERGTFYSDAWKLYKDYPLIGKGAGAWSAMYEEYQNNPYSSRQAHNFLMQHLVEAGTIGIILLLGFLLLVIVQFARARIAAWAETSNDNADTRMPYFLLVVPILIHSTIDFDISYVYIAAIVFLSLGAMTVDTKPIIRISVSSKWYRLYPISLVILSLIMIIGSTQFLRANSLYKLSLSRLQAPPSIEYFMEPLNQALSIREGISNYVIAKSDLLNQLYTQYNDEAYYSENLLLIDEALHSEPYNLQLLNRKTELLLSKDQVEQAYQTVSTTLTHFPWKPAVYEQHISLAIQLVEREISNNVWSHSQSYLDAVESTYKQLHQQIKHLGTLPEGQSQGNPFLTNITIELGAAKASYYQNRFSDTTAILEPYIAELQLQEPGQREVARWHLVALQRQGLEDKTLYDSLIQVDPNEMVLIEQLMNIDSPY